MATATLKFDLNDSDDRMEHLRAIKSVDMALILWEIRHNLRKRCENKCDTMVNGDQHDGMNIVMSEIDDLFEQHNIIIDELIN